MRQIILFYSLFVLVTQVQSQLLTFDIENYSPDWIHYPWVDGISEYEQWYTLVSDVHFGDDYALFVYNSNIFAPSGFLIEKVELETGKVLWSHRDFNDEKYNRTHVIDYEVKGTQIELYLIKESDVIDNNRFPIWQTGFLGTTTLDIETGEIVDTHVTDPRDSLNIPLSKDFISIDNLMLWGDEDGYTTIRQKLGMSFDSTRIDYVIRNSLNRQGHLIQSDTLFYEFLRIPGLIQTTDRFGSDDIVGHIGSYETLGTVDSLPVSFILRLKNDLTELDTIHLEDKIDLSFIEVLGSSSLDTLAIIIDASNKLPIKDEHILLFDIEGNKLSESRSIIPDSIAMTSRCYTKDYKLLGTQIKRTASDTNDVVIWRSRDDFDIDTLLNFNVIASDLDLITQDMVTTPDDDLLWNTWYRQESYPPEFPGESPPNWYAWIKINHRDLNPSTAVQSPGSVNQEAMIYPNPAQTALYIKDISDIQRVSIVDMRGQSVLNIDDPQKRLDISSLPSGKYWVRLFYTNSITLHPLVKI